MYVSICFLECLFPHALLVSLLRLSANDVRTINSNYTRRIPTRSP